MTTKKIRLGIISALAEEQAGLIHCMQAEKTVTRGMRDYVSGQLWEIDCVCVLSRIGKVAAAATVTTLIERFDVTHIIFTGVAGSAAQDVDVGDIVIAQHLIQHDMDASPLVPRFEVPLTGLCSFNTDVFLNEILLRAAEDFITHDFKKTIDDVDHSAFHLKSPRVMHGLIASGDEFISCSQRITGLKNALPALLAIEMEGAAVAQVCFEFGIPFAVIRTISDKADADASINFKQFVDRVARHYAFNIIKRACSSLVR